MKRSARALSLLSISAVILAGCWDYRELNELSLAMAMGVDKTDAGGYRVAMQVVNPKEAAGRNVAGSGVPVVVFTGTGQTMFEAIRNVTLKGSRRINLQHLRDLVIGEELARGGVKELFDLLERDHESRLTTRVYIAKGSDSEQVLKILTPLDQIPANAILGKIKLSERVLGENYEVDLASAIHGIYRKNGGFAISGLKIMGDADIGENRSNLQQTDSLTKITVAGMALFHNGKLTGWLYGKDARGLSWTNNKLKSTVVNLECAGNPGNIAIETYHSKTKKKARIRNGKPMIEIDIRQTGKVGEADCPVDLTKSAEIRKLEKLWEKVTKLEVEKAIEKVQHMGSDALEFGETVQRDEPKLWKKIEDKWSMIFPEVQVVVRAETSILRTGMRTKPSMSSK
ncbi:Ger(x)C family spore germination protein [Cohnella sp. CFH 77786]|uniref:Ger(x)C family spore germination protein n=1 Tax=Cohnella sp. CFH 77786 TaxID=2662265 RepID=UPI001C60B4A6|nr:Ger(x)C family spore germination protein [Cohnella sp. CFH 77786]MBW5445134.1 Ger(x)C family spore germination protein [Cohnella sp. CFH 77786]